MTIHSLLRYVGVDVPDVLWINDLEIREEKDVSERDVMEAKSFAEEHTDSEKITYEVWSIGGNPMTRHLISDDPVEIVHFIRKHPVGERWFKVHPRGDGFHQDAKIAHDFVSIHRMAAADDIVRKAFEAGEPEGIAKELNNLFFGR